MGASEKSIFFAVLLGKTCPPSWKSLILISHFPKKEEEDYKIGEKPVSPSKGLKQTKFPFFLPKNLNSSCTKKRREEKTRGEERRGEERRGEERKGGPIESSSMKREKEEESFL